MSTSGVYPRIEWRTSPERRRRRVVRRGAEGSTGGIWRMRESRWCVASRYAWRVVRGEVGSDLMEMGLK